jgi:hypothetical protein
MDKGGKRKATKKPVITDEAHRDHEQRQYDQEFDIPHAKPEKYVSKTRY